MGTLQIVFLIIGIIGLLVLIQVFIDTSFVKTRFFKHNLDIEDNIKICHLTDIHNHSDKYLNLKISDVIKKNSPDVIVITGDVIDEHVKNLNSIRELLENIKDYPVIYVNGNHELRTKYYAEMISCMNSYPNVSILKNDLLVFEKGNTKINILGLEDYGFNQTNEMIDTNLNNLLDKINNDYQTILLAHRPELLPVYAKDRVNICFTGHAHAGQINLPGRSLIAPGQGLFPKYNKGKYVLNKTTMYLSSGLGESGIFLRYNSRREIYFVTLGKEEKNEIL